MKDNDHILNLQETEQLCRLYMECQLSVLEERELQYILGKMDYSSPIIDEARQSMMAEGLLTPTNLLATSKKERKKPKFKWLRLTAGAAASLAIVISLSIFILKPDGDNAVKMADNHKVKESTSSSEIVIAYEGGKKLNQEDSEKAVTESIKKAEALMAMAQAQIKEEESKQEYFIHLISDKK
ncbi:MAG: hypothetical protein K2K81_09150 [Muribaculaceae bacterium]|nr:hypothetical protein [Muribaculaceae bacterium]